MLNLRPWFNGMLECYVSRRSRSRNVASENDRWKVVVGKTKETLSTGSAAVGVAFLFLLSLGSVIYEREY